MSVKGKEREAPSLLVRFTDGIPDLALAVHPDDAVRDIKLRVRDARPHLHNRRLRLIHAGRLLQDSTRLSSLPHPQTTTFIHCSVGAPIPPGDNDDDAHVQSAQLTPPRGFDRLVSVGFSPQDIDNFRRQFHSQSSNNYLDHDFETEEEYDEHARALEEQWIDSIDSVGSATLSNSASSSSSSVLYGILLGFFFPFLPLFFLRSQKQPIFWQDGSEHDPTSNVIFSRRMSMGIAVGFLINILFGLWRYLLDST